LVVNGLQMMQLGSWQRRIFCTSAFLTISGVSCNITVGTFHAAPGPKSGGGGATGLGL